MARRNLTVQLDEETIRKARVIAASRGRSVSRLVADTLEQIVRSEGTYQAAREAALRHLSKPFRLGGVIRVSRDAWHER